MTKEQKDGNQSGSFSPQSYSLNLGDQMKELTEVTEKYKAIAENPLVFSQIFLGLKSAMDNFNNLLIDLNKRLVEIDERISSLESQKSHDTLALSKKDQEILDYVKSKDRVSAEDLQKHLKYKGKHAASARLHKLFTMGALDKTHAGRTVYYIAPKPKQP
jgi:predicted HTH transcriptional regulator